MKFSSSNRFFEEIRFDERQKVIRGEIAHQCMQLWYVLNIMFTFAAAAFCLIDFVPALPAMAVITGYFCITFFCLSVYSFKSAKKGVLASFTGVKMTKKGNVLIIACFAYCIFILITTSANGTGILHSLTAVDRALYIAWLAVGIIFDIANLICIKINDNVVKAQLEEDGEE